MLGHLEVAKGFVAAQPGVQRIRGPHSISLLSHAGSGEPWPSQSSIICNRLVMRVQPRSFP